MLSKFAKVTVAGILIAGLSGCAPSGPKSYETIDDLVSAYVAAGQDCDWEQNDNVEGSLASGTCSDTSVLSLWLDSGDALNSAQNLADFAADYDIKVKLLVGPNWLINDPDVVNLQKVLGGQIVSN
jgi:hypothetical protein